MFYLFLGYIYLHVSLYIVRLVSVECKVHYGNTKITPTNRDYFLALYFYNVFSVRYHDIVL